MALTETRLWNRLGQRYKSINPDNQVQIDFKPEAGLLSVCKEAVGDTHTLTQALHTPDGVCRGGPRFVGYECELSKVLPSGAASNFDLSIILSVCFCLKQRDSWVRSLYSAATLLPNQTSNRVLQIHLL